MNVFDKRPLALILCITVGGFAFSTLLEPQVKNALFLLSALAFALSFIKIFKKQKTLIRISSVLVVASILFSTIYFDHWFKAYNRYDEKAEITATVVESRPLSSYTTEITFKSDNVNGTFASNYKFLAYLPTEECSRFSSGTITTFKADIIPFSSEDAELNYFSDGISGQLDNIEGLKIIDVKDFYLPKILSRIKEHISRYLTMLSDSETGGLLSALLLGERNKLAPETRLNFKRIGITHVLALSGMHLAILSVGLDKLLQLLQIKKKVRLSLTSAFVILYMLLTGFSVSVQRAGIMLLLSSALFLVSKTKDSFTSLTVSVFLICLITPYSLYDVSLWLSAFATLGLIVLGEYCATRERPEGVPRKLLSYCTVGILSSLFAISSTLLISLVTFGSVSMLGVISTLIFSVLIEIIMYLGCITMVVGMVVPVGKLLSMLCNFTTDLTELFAAPDFVYVRNSSALTAAFTVILTVLFFAFVILKIKHKRIFISIIASAFVLCHVIPLISYDFATRDDIVNYYSENKRDDFIIRSDGDVCYISSAQYSKSLAYSVIEALERENVTSLTAFYLTHYSYSIEDELNVVLSNVKTDKIYLPKPKNEKESDILEKLKRFISNYSAEIVLLETNGAFEIGKYKITPLYIAPYGETSMNAFSISSNTETVCYISSGLLNSKIADKMYKYISCSDQIVFGTHGKGYKGKNYIENVYPELKRLIIGSSNLFLTQESMIEYTENGCEVLSHPSVVELLD